MFELLKSYKGSLEVNGEEFESVKHALSAFKDHKGELIIVLNKTAENGRTAVSEGSQDDPENKIYKIKVRQYMTRPATPEFDFHDKWNKGQPMPMRIMVGRKLKETKGMIQMELWADITEEIAHTCMKCGRPLTNPVSKYFGIGPECGDHGYNNPFETPEELKEAVAAVRTQLREIRWTGWIIKSAIEEEEILKNWRE